MGHYGATNWLQSQIQMESPDQEGGTEATAELDFNTTTADSGAHVYHFSYRLDSLVTSFDYELNSASEGSTAWKSGTATAVPLSPTVLLLGSGILGLVGLRGFRSGTDWTAF